MALTGRTALLAALGSLPVGILAPSWTGMLAVNAPLSLAILCDYALAAPVRTLQFTRSGDTTVRLGESAEVQLTVTNPSRRRLRAHLRDAWPPSSWPTGTEQPSARHTLTIPAGNAVGSPPCCGPRGAETAEPNVSPSARSDLWGSRPAKGITKPRGRYVSCHRSPVASTCRPVSPDSGSSTAAAASSPAGTARSSTACVSTFLATIRVPSTGGPQHVTPPSRCEHGDLSVTATSSSPWTPAVLRRVVSVMCPVSMPPWTRLCSSPRWHLVQATVWIYSPTTAESEPRSRAGPRERSYRPW